MGASEIIRHVYKDTLDHFGEPDGSIRFCDPPPPPNSGWPERIDVFYWYDTDDLDITTFATIGMADKPMVGCQHRCELHFSLRKPAKAIDLNKVCDFCANIALYPFMNHTFFNWCQTLYNPGPIPYFPNCTALYFYPAFVEDGWDTIEFNETTIRIINLVPITSHEVKYKKQHNPFFLLDYFHDNNIDLFQDRETDQKNI